VVVKFVKKRIISSAYKEMTWFASPTLTPEMEGWVLIAIAKGSTEATRLNLSVTWL